MILCRCHKHPCSLRAKSSILLLISGHRQRRKNGFPLLGEAAGLGQVSCHYGLYGELHHMLQAPSLPVLVSWAPVRACYLYSFEWDQHTQGAFINTITHVPRSGAIPEPYHPPTNHSYVPHTSSPRISEYLLIHTHQVNSIFFSFWRDTYLRESLSGIEEIMNVALASPWPFRSS